MRRAGSPRNTSVASAVTGPTPGWIISNRACCSPESLSEWQGRGLFQAKFEQGLAWDVNLLAFLGYGADRSSGCADGRAHARVAGNGSDRRPEAGSAEQAPGASLAAAASFDLVIAGQERIRRATNNDFGQFECEFRRACRSSRLFGLRELAVDGVSSWNDDGVADRQIGLKSGGKTGTRRILAGVDSVQHSHEYRGASRDSDHVLLR